MNKTPEAKTGATEKNLRNLFIIFLLFTFLVTAGSFFLKYSISQKLDRLSGQFNEPSQTQEISNILLDLNSAENDFQQASLIGQSEKLDAYKTKLSNIFKRISGVLTKYQADSARYFPGSQQHIARAIDQKVSIAQKVFILKRQFDSLLNVTTSQNINAQVAENVPQVFNYKRSLKSKLADTTISLNQGPKKGLLKRLKDAIVNKNDAPVKVLTIRREKQIRDSITQSLNRKHKNTLGKLLNDLKQQNEKVQQSNKQLIAANLGLLNQLHQLLQQLKDIQLEAREKNRNEILAQYQQANGTLNTFIGFAIPMILIFIVLLLIYIRKAAGAEKMYLMENERAIALASQKSEILAIMSHELRNPLTAITGTIYMLNKTPLNEDQQKKLASINLSSVMLMETIKNILDVSKIEQQQSGILTVVEFRPYNEIKEALETMSFMAERKGIYLTDDFTGDMETLVYGDAFRLKQVMMNLLSNAIKYTHQGGVTVKAVIRHPQPNISELEVSVVDTGVGIPKDQQAGLFTRYYQANRPNGQPGTGLGLFICKQIIDLQKGSIRVESEAGKGCYIQFNIPYKNSLS